MPYVDALMAIIFRVSYRLYFSVFIINNLSKRSTGIPCGEIISVPLIEQIPLLVAKITIGARVDSSALFKKVKH